MILEYEQIRSLKENPEFSGVAEKLYDVETFGFNVLVKLEHADSEAKRVMLQHLIDRYKPAFATARLIVLQPWVYTDLHSYLGLNTVLSEPALLKLDGYSSMPHHTITIDVGQENRVDRHTRLELDSQLE
jgi:DNA primase catalytic subunit